VPPLKEPEKEKDPREAARSWMKYSGMAVQMIGVLLAFVFAGKYLDQWLDTDPWLTLVMSLLGVGSALYVSLKDFI
jgi:F0F1-type ATP synthase assembly protein I